MSNKLCLYERGNVTEPEMCSVWLKNSIFYNSCQYSFVIASVGFNIDRVTTQHTPKCVKNEHLYETLYTEQFLPNFCICYIIVDRP